MTIDDRAGMFSTVVPGLQLAWDATSFGALMFCPRYYQLSIIEGWRKPGTVDLEFGGFFASSVEMFKKFRHNGDSKDDALVKVLRWLLEATAYADGSFWSGSYDVRWRCTGSEPYRNPKGNRAKCPWSHKGVWVPGLAPSHCGHCGSPTEVGRHWISNDPYKDRYTLVRLIVG